MTSAEMITLVKNRLHRPGATEADILAEIQAAQRELEQRQQLPWFLLRLVKNLYSADDVRTMGVPPDFLRESEEAHALWYVPSSGADHVPLQKEEYDVLYAAYGETKGLPVAYSLRYRHDANPDTLIYLFPKPNGAYNYYLWCYLAAPVLDANSSNVWTINAPDLLINKAARDIAINFRDFEAASYFDKAYQQSFGMLMATHFQRKEAGRRIEVGEGV